MYEALRFLLNVVGVGGGAAFIAYQIFKKLGEKWVDDKFARRLQELQHTHEYQLETVRHAVQSTHSRISKIHEREFNVLPRLWLLLNQATGIASSALGFVLEHHPDINRMSDEKAAEFLTAMDFDGEQRQQILSSEDRLNKYLELRTWKTISEGRRKNIQLANFLIKHRLFMTPVIHKLSQDACSSINLAVHMHAIQLRQPNANFNKQPHEHLTEAQNLLPLISEAIQARLCYDAAGVQLPSEPKANSQSV